MLKILSFLSCFVLLIAQKPKAQMRDSSDGDDYFITFEEQLTTRLYISKKHTSFVMQGPEGIHSIQYKPNTLTSLGINASYKSLSLSLGYGFPFLNPNKDEKGKTRTLDFQTHLYTRHWVTDIYLQFYKGYYFSAGGPEGTTDKYYYTRPDIKLSFLGTSVYRLLNGEKFSYRAGFLQNEWQKKSAGSVLLGGEIYYGTVKGDSALVPARLNDYYPQQGIERIRLLEVGPGAGYAYTAVWRENFFLTGSLTFNGDISMVKEMSDSVSVNRTSISPNATLRAVAGYNNEGWAATISWVHNSTDAKGRSSNYEYRIKTGEFRITLAKRFTPGNKLKGKLEPIIEKLP
jgi:hypothetical protein